MIDQFLKIFIVIILKKGAGAGAAEFVWVETFSYTDYPLWKGNGRGFTLDFDHKIT